MKKIQHNINIVRDSILNGNLVPKNFLILIENKIILKSVDIDIKLHKKYFYIMQKYL